MELTNEFEVAVPVAEAWAVLTDLERIAPCMPGAELKEVEGDEYRGVVKVKVGPITASYRGAAMFKELDAEHHRAVLKADGRETRGQGNASATITATLAPSGTGTKVTVATDIAITGKVTQFGRGVLADVSGKLLDQFVNNLETMVLAPGATPAPAEATRSGSTKATAAGAAKVATSEAASTKTPTPAVTEATAAAPAVTKTEAAAGEPTVAESGAPESPAPHSAAPESPAPESHAPESTETGATSPSAAGEAASPDATDGREIPADPETPSIRQIQSVPAEPIELLNVAGSSVARRMVPFASVAGVLVLIRIIIYAMKRRAR